MQNFMIKKNEGEILSSFVMFINSKNNKKRIIAGTGRGKPVNDKVKLLEISQIVLVAGMKPNVLVSLIGYNLNFSGVTKKITISEMDQLYDFIELQNKLGEFVYISSYSDISIIDGNDYIYYINWNSIQINHNGGNTMPSGFSKLLDYCKILVNKR